MTWSNSIKKQTDELIKKKTKETAQAAEKKAQPTQQTTKKQDSSFYNDYQAKTQVKKSKTTFTPSVKKTETTDKTPTRNIFVPSTVKNTTAPKQRFIPVSATSVSGKKNTYSFQPRIGSADNTFSQLQEVKKKNTFVPSTVQGKQKSRTAFTPKNAEKSTSNIGIFGGSTFNVKNQLQSMNRNGNVDLLHRPVINADRLEAAGWGKQNKGTATVYSSSYSNADGTRTVLVTPILKNGRVLTPAELQREADSILSGQNRSSETLLGVFEGKDSIKQANAYGEKLHQLHQEYYKDHATASGTATSPKMTEKDLDRLLGEDTKPQLQNPRVTEAGLAAYLDSQPKMNSRFYDDFNKRRDMSKNIGADSLKAGSNLKRSSYFNYEYPSDDYKDLFFTDIKDNTLRSDLLKYITSYDRNSSVQDRNALWQGSAELAARYKKATGKNFDIAEIGNEYTRAQAAAEQNRRDNYFYRKLEDYYSRAENADFDTVAGKFADPTYYGKDKDHELAMRKASSMEQKIYHYLRRTEGDDAAEDFLDRLEILTNQRVMQEVSEPLVELGENHRVLGGVGNAVVGLGKGMSYVDNAGQALGQALSNNDTYRPYNPYTPMTAAVHFSNALKSGVTNDLTGAEKVAAGILLNVGENTVRLALGPAGLYVMGAGAAGETAVNQGLKGETNAGRAFATGTAYGAVEIATEKLPLDNLLKILNSPPTNIKQAIVTLLKNASVEGGEEAISNIADNIADKIINGDRSEFEQYRNALMQNGISEDKATLTAFLKFYVSDTVTDAAQGAAAGALMSGGTMAISSGAQYYDDVTNIGQEMKNLGAAESVVNEGLARDAQTSANRYAQRMQSKLDSGKDLTDWNVGRQYLKNVNAIQSEEQFINSLSGIVPTEVTDRLYDDKGKELNGQYTGGEQQRVGVSANGDMSIPAAAKHEFTHAFKQIAPTAYSAYENYVINAAMETNAEAVNNRLQFLKENYGYSDEVAREEIAAELTGTFNTKAAEKIANGNITLADNIVGAIRTAKAQIRTAYSKGNYENSKGVQLTFEQLNNAEKLWNKALSEAAENGGQAQTETVSKSSPIEKNLKGKYVQADRQAITSDNPNDWEGQIYDYINNKIRNGQDVVIPTDDGDNLTITEKTAWKMGYRNRVNDNGTVRPYNNTEYRTKINAAAHIDELAEISKRGKQNYPDTKNHDFAQGGFNYRTAYFRDLDGKYYRLTISVGENTEGKTVYNIGNIKKVPFPDNGSKASSSNAARGERNFNGSVSPSEGATSSAIAGNAVTSVDNNIIPENEPIVKKSVKENTGNQTKMDNITAYKMARELVNNYAVRGKVNIRELSGRLSGLAEAAHDIFYSGNVVEKYPEFEARARSIAADVVSEMRYTAENEEMYKDMRKYIKSMRIKITDEIKSDIPDWNEFRKRNTGKITMSYDGTPIDVLYKDLMERFPGSFDEAKQMTQADQLIHIADTLDALKAKDAKLNEADYAQAVDEITDKILSAAINIAGEYKGEVNIPEETEFDRDAQAAHEAAAPWESYADEWNVPEFTRAEYEGMKDKLTQKQQKMVERLREQYKKQREAERDRRLDAEDRNRLLKLAREVNNMRMSPEEMAHVPDILKEIDTKSVRILKKGFTTSDGRTVMGELDLKQLRDDYEMIAQTDPDFIPNKDIEAKIGRLDKMQIADMDISDVRELIRTVQEVKHEIRTNRKLINDAERREVALTAARVVQEIYNSKGSNYLKRRDRFLDNYNSIQLSAMREFRRLSGYATDSELVALGEALNDGQRKSLEFQQRTTRKFEDLVAKSDEMKRFTGKKAERIDISNYTPFGQKVYITPEMRVALYLHSKNYYSLRHINNGGITVPEINLLEKGDYKNALARGTTIKLTPSQVKSITDGMSDFEKAFADKAYEFFNKDSKAAVNETSLALKGYELAQVKDYFPITTDKNFTSREFESLIKDGTLEGSGYLKERVNASSPIILEGVVSVIARQQKSVGDYYGLAIPIRNFNKVYNATGSNYAYSTKQAFGKKWGANATNYIENLITDLQNGRKGSGNSKFDATLSKFKGNYAQAVLALNPTVIMQQAASYPTAAAVVGWKPLIKGLASEVTDYDKAMIDKYTPLLWYRSKGYSTSELGDFADGTSEDWTKNGKAPSFMGLIQAVDVGTVTKLWKAAEFYVQDNHTEFEEGSDEYYKQVAEVYNKVIEETQPNYTTMQRPDLLRSPNKLINAMTMFKTQIMQNYNILYDGYGEWDAKRRAYKAKQNETTKAEYKAAQGKFGRAISSQIMAALVLSLMKGVGNHLKGKFKKRYSDKDGELSNESIFNRYALDVAETLAGTVLGGGEIIEGIETIANKIAGNNWRDAEVISAPSLTAINDFVGTLYDFAAVDYGDVFDNPRPFIKALNELAKSAGKIKGVPVENVENILMGAVNNIISQFDDTGRLQQGIIDGYKVAYFKELLNTELNHDNAKKFYSILRGAKQHAEETTGKEHFKAQRTYDAIYNHMLDNGVTEKQLENALKDKTVTAKKDKGEDIDLSIFRQASVPQALKTKNEEIQANEAREEFAKEHFEALAASIAKDAPDKADGYKSSGFEIKDIQSGTINGKSYDITGDIKTKVIEAANKKYYDDLARLENNEVNVEDIVGYTKKGKARTSTAMDGTEVSLTGKLYNEDGTPRFDSLVTSRIYLKAKESAKDSAINEYADEITGNATETHTESEESTKVSLVQKGSSGGSTKNSKYTFKGTSDGGSKKRSGLAGNASRGSSSYVNVTPATSDRELHSLAAASILNSQGIPNIGNNVYQIVAHNLIKNGKIQPIRANKIEPIKPLGLI